MGRRDKPGDDDYFIGAESPAMTMLFFFDTRVPTSGSGMSPAITICFT
jgi:hypothetical protein